MDGESKITTILTPLGESTSLSYDQHSNVIGIGQPAGSYTSLGYIQDGLVSSLTDPAGNTYQFGHDASLNRSSVADPSGAAIVSTFDTHGDILTQTNRRGKTTSYTYNNFGLLATQTRPAGSVTSYTYDGHQNLQSVSSPSGAIQFTYNAADQLTGVSNPDGTSLSYAYNSLGQKTRVTDSSGFTAAYGYDSAGRLSTISSGSGTLATLAYDAGSRILSRTFANGTSTSYTYDAAGNVLSLIHHGSAGNVLSEYDYTYDADGRALTQKTPAGTITYTYDLNGQLISANGPGTAAQYTYDIDGNRTTSATNGAAATWFANNLNQYSQVNSAPFTYDLDGNLLSGNGITYTYDEQNRLLTQSSATDTWSYQYDALGSRNAVTHNGVTTRLLVDAAGPGNVLAEFSSTGTPQAHYVYGDQLIGSVQPSGTQGFYHFDGTGNTVLVTGSGGTVADSYSYLPFGEKDVTSSSIYNPFTYSGAYGVRDEGSGLFDMHLRAYNPALGRFQQEDPLDFSGGDTNLYRYAGNAPVLTVDPEGMDFLQTAKDKLTTYDGGLTQIANYASGFVPASFSKTSSAFAVFGLPSTFKSYVNNVSSGNVLYAIHDFTTATLTGAQIYLNHNPAATQALTKTIPGAALYLLINGASYIDQGSQDIFGAFFDGYYSTPSPVVCGKCLTTPGPNQGVPVTSSLDPNGKITSGFGDNGYVPVNVPITYTVYFENQPTATAAAVKVSVTDQLATNLDWSTLQLNSIAFNDATLTIPAGTQTYSAQATVSTDANPVNVAAALNPATGLLTVTMQSVDPITGTFPTNPTAGFLPPNNAANAGVGSVTFTIAPKHGLANATQLSNQAGIVFDANAAITTNTVTNTLDTTSPFSSVNPLPATTISTSIPVSWSGTDPTGSGIASYNIYVSIDGGAYALWLSATTGASATYTGALVGHTYAFYSLATNNVGTTQTAAGTPQLIAVQGQQPAVTVTPASPAITSAQSLSVTINVAGAGSPTPTGSIVLSSGSYASSATTLTGGAASIVIPAGALAAGTDTLIATYTPDRVGAQTYASATGTGAVTVSSPNVQVTVGTSPAGEAFSVDGTSYTTAQTFTWTTGSTHTLATTSPQTVSGTQATFVSWSDAGAISHTITASSGPASYIATFALLPIPQASLTPTSLTFTAFAGIASAAQAVTLTNTGTGPLNLSSITLTGANASVFAQTSTCGSSVAAGTSCTVSITFTPASSGSYAATLTISDNAANSPQTVALTGTGSAAPTFSLSATPPQQTITFFQTATYAITVTPNGGPFTSAVALSADGLPAGVVATFTPSSVIPGAAAATSTLTLRFASAHSENRPFRHFPNDVPVLAVIGLAVLATYRRRGLLNLTLLAALLMVPLAGISGCGTGPVTYTVTVTGSGGNGQTARTTVVLTTK